MQILFIRLLEIVAVVLLITMFISQILTPIVKGTRLFPYFRTQRDFEKKLRATRQDLNEAQIELEIKKEEQRVAKAREQLKK